MFHSSPWGWQMGLGLGLGLAFPSAFIRRNDVQNWINFSIKHAAWTWGNAACGNHSLEAHKANASASSCNPDQVRVQARLGRFRFRPVPTTSPEASRIVNCTCRLLLRCHSSWRRRGEAWGLGQLAQSSRLGNSGATHSLQPPYLAASVGSD